MFKTLKFAHHNVTEYNTYCDEASLDDSVLTSGSGLPVLSSLRNIFLSLTFNSKQIFLIIAKYQISNVSKNYEGKFSFSSSY